MVVVHWKLSRILLIALECSVREAIIVNVVGLFLHSFCLNVLTFRVTFAHLTFSFCVI